MGEKQFSLLIVDDDAMNLDSLLATLGNHYDLRMATSGQAALDLLDDDYLPDLILLDIMMPGQNGFQICKTLKSSEKTRDIPVIFLTALTDFTTETKGLELGAVDFITKPINPALVTLRIKNQLELQQHQNNLQHLVEEKTYELAQSYDELHQLHHQMISQEKMASIGQLAAGVAHEINNPTGYIKSNFGTLRKYLTKVTDYIQFLEQQLEQPSLAELQLKVEQKKKKLKLDMILDDLSPLIDESTDGVDKIATIVRNLKSFSREEQDKFEESDLESCLDSSINISWNEIKYKAEVVKNYTSPPQVRCLPQQLGQVFVNLLVNAAQSIESQGILTISTKTVKNWVVVTIADNGCGMSAEIQNQIFEPFFTTKKNGHGTGLGLSICHDIIKKHDGLISVESTPGEGTRFTIQIPLQQN